MINQNIPKKSVVFITGSSRGIGLAIAQKFKANNWIVAGCSSTKNTRSEAILDFYKICDIRDKKAIKETIDALIKQFGRLDVLINNAGIGGPNSIDYHENDDRWHDIINVNLHGTYYTTKYALPHIIQSQGRILNIASICGIKASTNRSAYTSSKHAIIGFTKSLALDYAKTGITANAVCPTLVRTSMLKRRQKECRLTEAEFKKRLPLGKIISPQEVA